MRAQEWEASRSHRFSSEPGEKMLRAAESGPNPLWSGSLLPQIDAIPNTRPQFPCATAIGDRYRPQSDEREAMSKRPRYEASSGNPMLRDPRNSPGKMVISAVRSRCLPSFAPRKSFSKLNQAPAFLSLTFPFRSHTNHLAFVPS